MSLSRQVRVKSRQTEADGICSFQLVAEDGGALTPFEAGSHVDVEVQPGTIRQYSLYNDPADRSNYSIAVLKDNNGRGGSVAMHRDADAGSVFRISEPRNNFPLRGTSNCPLLIAGGIGVTPLLSMARHLSSCGAEFEMHYCTRTLSRTAFVEEIRNSPFSKSVNFHFDDGPEEQRFSAAKLFTSTRVTDDRDLYVCGPQPFIELIEAAAKDAGWQRGRVHREFFSLTRFESGAGGEFRIQLKSSGRIFTVPADKSAVDILRENHINIEVSCEQGICGTCVTRVIEGQLDHRDMYLSDDEKASGKIFTPCCSRGQGMLVLDL
jgi:vanillate O-demethylase ferredoxin subunit